MSNPASPTPAGPSNTKRNPPPTLFQAPTNASSVSLTSPPSSTGTAQRTPLSRSRTARDPDSPALQRNRGPAQTPQSPAAAAAAGGQSEDNRVDALWAKMQLTLEEVELSALGSTHVFGSAHNAALEELREAQIALAKDWGRGEADEDFEAVERDGEAGVDAKGKESGEQEGEGEGEGEDEGDIREARRRKEANERFFKKVGEGVVGVVGKLEGVAAAMAKVEKESREIWDERESLEGSSIASLKYS